MKRKGEFPTEYRSFTNGPLSLRVERYGNLDLISWYEIREFEGKNYPDRHPVPFFSRIHCDTLRMAPAVNFFQEDANGLRRDFVPADSEWSPNGYLSERSSLRMKQNCFSMEFKPFSNRPFSIMLRKTNVPDGILKTMKNQIVGSWKSHCRFSREDLKQMGISEDDLDLLSDEMSSMFGQMEDGDEDETEGRTATFPLLNQLFGGDNLPQKGQKPSPEKDDEEKDSDTKSKKNKRAKLKAKEKLNMSLALNGARDFFLCCRKKEQEMAHRMTDCCIA